MREGRPGHTSSQLFRLLKVFWKGNFMGWKIFLVVLLVAVLYSWKYIYSIDVFWRECHGNQELNVRHLYYNQLKGWQRYNNCHRKGWVKISSFLWKISCVYPYLFIHFHRSTWLSSCQYYTVLIAVAINKS